MFTRCDEDFPCQIEKALEVARAHLKEADTRFWIPKSIQNDNGLVFKTDVSQAESEDTI